MSVSHDAPLVRPSQSELRASWISLFSHPEITVQDLQDQANLPSGLGQEEDDLGGVALRSVYWRIYLGTLPLETLQSGSSTPLRSHLQAQRREYDRKRERWLKAPDGRWASDCSVPGDGSEHKGNSRQSGSATWDPLNLGEENPWQAWFQNAELRKTIEKDVERTFPDMDYFSDLTVRKILTTILFLWAIEHEDVGYRQGMHELLATILMIVDRDSIPVKSGLSISSASTMSPLQEGSSSPISRLEESMSLVLDRSHVEHDTYALFCRMMQTGKDWYEWRTEAIGTSTLQRRAKIIDFCEHMQDDLLKRVDPILHAKFAAEGIEGQLWGIRYVRLLFTREMPFRSALRIWDGLFAAGGRVDELVSYVCVAMLLRIRHLLLPCDYTGVLTMLLKYPPHSAELPLDPALLLRQARAIRDNPSPSTGAAITLQNQETLGIPAYEPDGTESTPSVSHHQTLRSRQRSAASPNTPARLPGVSPRAYGGFESLARGLVERAQASGIDKTILSTVSEFRKNLPDFNPPAAPTFPFRTFSQDAPGDVLYDTDMAQADQDYLAAPARTLLDAEREIAELRLVMIGMGKAMGTWMDVVHQPDHSKPETEPTSADQAWTGMKRLQESLLDGGAASTNDLARIWAWSQDLHSISTPASTVIGSSYPRSPTFAVNGPNGIDPSPRLSTHATFGMPSPTLATPGNFNAPRHYPPESKRVSLNSPRNLNGFGSPKATSFGPAVHQSRQRDISVPSGQISASPTQESNASHPVSDPLNPPFEMPKSSKHAEDIGLEAPKKTNVDPLLGMGF